MPATGVYDDTDKSTQKPRIQFLKIHLNIRLPSGLSSYNLFLSSIYRVKTVSLHNIKAKQYTQYKYVQIMVFDIEVKFRHVYLFL
jgi:hypothetical protein